MTSFVIRFRNWVRGGSRVVVIAIFAVGVAVLLLWLAGKFAPKVSTTAKHDVSQHESSSGRIATARVVEMPLVETAVGTIRPVHETSIGSKLLARVVHVNLKAGQTVDKGDVLVRLDDTDLRAKVKQAQATLAAAEAKRSMAGTDAERYADLVKQNAVSQQDNERAMTALKAANAELSRAREALKEIEVTLDWATIRSPMDGLVIDKKVDVGDMVSPGQTLATLLDPKRMQLVASVRESLAHRLRVGQSIEVQIENIKKECRGTISEIVPEAESASRAFQVKVTGPCPEGIYSGMFGRILIPLDQERVLLIPRDAVQTVGQLELVSVVDNGKVNRRAIRVGRVFGKDVEVLSGLHEGEQIELPAPLSMERESRHG